MARTLLSWAPAAGAVVVVAAAAIAIPMAASASSALPVKTPHEVIQMIASSKVDALSGTITQTSDLGLPSLPTTGAGSDSSVASTLSLLTGDHSIRVYIDGAKKERAQVLDTNDERDVIRNGSSVWVWDYKANTAEHATLTAPKHKRGLENHAPKAGALKQGDLPYSSTPKTPSEIATRLVSALSSSSTLTVASDVPDVAGRSVYDLVLTPKASDTLVGSVTIAVDSATGLPLAVDVDASGQTTPAFSVAFSQLQLGAPAASLFTFTPPAGAKVTEAKSHSSQSHKAQSQKAQSNSTKKPGASKKAAKPTVTGSGWDAVVAIPKQASLTKFEASKDFTLLTSPVAGGRIFHTSLVNVLFATDGRVLVGSVSEARLEAVASGS